jgi:hypothetical protein
MRTVTSSSQIGVTPYTIKASGTTPHLINLPTSFNPAGESRQTRTWAARGANACLTAISRISCVIQRPLKLALADLAVDVGKLRLGLRFPCRIILVHHVHVRVGRQLASEPARDLACLLEHPSALRGGARSRRGAQGRRRSGGDSERIKASRRPAF